LAHIALGRFVRSSREIGGRRFFAGNRLAFGPLVSAGFPTALRTQRARRLKQGGGFWSRPGNSACRLWSPDLCEALQFPGPSPTRQGLAGGTAVRGVVDFMAKALGIGWREPLSWVLVFSEARFGDAMQVRTRSVEGNRSRTAKQETKSKASGSASRSKGKKRRG